MIGIRTLGLALAAMFAMSAVVASAAFADAAYEITENTPDTFASTSGASVLTVPGFKVTATASTGEGSLATTTTATKVKVIFTGATIENLKTKETASIKSVGAGKAGEIVVKPLKGTVGEIVGGAPLDKAGLLLEPETGTEFVTFEKTAVSPETKVKGKIAGQIKVAAAKSTKGELIFGVTGGKQNVTEWQANSDVTPVKPVLTAFGETATEETTDSVTFVKVHTLGEGL